MKQSKSLKKTPLRRKSPLRARYQKKEQSKFEATEVKVKKPLEDKRKHTDELDKVFQFYVRLRDALPGGDTVCISCGKKLPFYKMQGGHYCSRTHMSTRWSELNVHSECFSCNCKVSDHLIPYRKNLIRKIGEKKVEWIEAYCHVPKKWSDFELVIMIKDYCKKCVLLSKDKGIPISTNIAKIIKKYSKT